MTTLKAGLIGCGGRGRAHAEGYLAADNANIAACADPIVATRESFARDFAVANTYDDYRAMLDGEDLDLVSVCTWTGQHRTMVEAAATSGVSTTVGRTVLTRIWCFPSSSAWMRMMWSRLALVDE